MRAYNQMYGDDITHRQNDIRTRLASYDQFSGWMADTHAWEALTPDQRSAALNQLAAGVFPDDAVVLNTPYPEPDSVATSAQGTKPWQPGLPSPEPNPSPTLPS